MKKTKDSIALRHVKKIMSKKNQYKHGKCDSKTMMIISLTAFVLGIINAVFTSHVVNKCIWSLFTGVQFANFMKQLMIKGFIEYIDEQGE